MSEPYSETFAKRYEFFLLMRMYRLEFMEVKIWEGSLLFNSRGPFLHFSFSVLFMINNGSVHHEQSNCFFPVTLKILAIK